MADTQAVKFAWDGKGNGVPQVHSVGCQRVCELPWHMLPYSPHQG